MENDLAKLVICGINGDFDFEFGGKREGNEKKIWGEGGEWSEMHKNGAEEMKRKQNQLFTF